MPRHREFDQTEVLAKAMDIFWSHGYEASSIRDLEQCMGIGRGSMYLTFGDKQALFRRALEAFCANFTQLFSQTFANATCTRDALREVMTEALSCIEDGEPRRGCFITNSIIELAPKDDAIAITTSKTLSQAEDIIYASLVRDRSAGLIAKDRKLRALARYLICSTQGLSVMMKSGASIAHLKDIMDIILEQVQ